MIGILNYGVGNPAAVVRMCESVSVGAELVQPGQNLNQFLKIVLPGVGHFDACVSALHSTGVWDELNSYFANQRGTILGICVGAQVLGRRSEEGSRDGLGFIQMQAEKIVSSSVQIPHMGWAETTWISSKVKPWFENSRFYYSHSYTLTPDKESLRAATFEYDGLRTGAVLSDQVIAVQFHPEKSHRYGKKLFQWFHGWNP